MKTIERTILPRRPSGLEAWIQRIAPFDCILGQCPFEECPGSGHHGRGSAQYVWVLRGEGLAVSWLRWADEHLPETIEALNTKHGDDHWRQFHGTLSYLSYHSAVRLHGGDSHEDECEHLGLPCWFEGSSVDGDVGLELLAESEEAAWAWLEGWWQQRMREAVEASRR